MEKLLLLFLLISFGEMFYWEDLLTDVIKFNFKMFDSALNLKSVSIPLINRNQESSRFPNPELTYDYVIVFKFVLSCAPKLTFHDTHNGQLLCKMWIIEQKTAFLTVIAKNRNQNTKGEGEF